MFVIHQASAGSIKKIITSKYLKPATLTKQKNQSPYKEHLPAVYFATCNKSDFPTLYPYTFIFGHDILLGKTVYTNNTHVGKVTASTTTLSKLTDRKTLLAHTAKLLKDSRVNKLFMIFQELFVKSSVPVSKAKYLVLPGNADKTLTTLVSRQFPNIKIIYK